MLVAGNLRCTGNFKPSSFGVGYTINKQCIDCSRHKTPDVLDKGSWMTVPALVGECEYRVSKESEKLICNPLMNPKAIGLLV